MDITVSPSSVSGSLRAPSSKSQAIRLIAAAMLARGKSRIKYPSTCDDALAMKKIAESMGARIDARQDFWEISGGVEFSTPKINCGESGLAARLMIALATLGSTEIEVTGEGTLLSRHLGNICETLGKMGVKSRSMDGKLPYFIHGPASCNQLEVDGSGGSQFVSGLLMTLPLLKNDSTLIVHNLKSIPYIDMTLEVLQASGIEIENQDYHEFSISGNQTYQPIQTEVEGDWSGAAFPLVAGALAGEVLVTGLDLNSRQADRKIMEALEKSGTNLEIKPEGILVKRSSLKPFIFDATHCPDLFPPLAVLAAASDGISKISGVGRLAQKESNRGIVLQNELGKLGINIELDGDLMIIQGGPVSGGEIFSHHDHRIAMAGAVAGLIAKKPVTIQHAECVSKSYPDFFKDIENLGAAVSFA
jgi:3-phosphoshikimate 1-carboxyvinyltransferase